MIPKIFHHIWVGPDPMPEKEVRCIASWKKYHPHWKFILWTDSNIASLKMPLNCIEAIKKSEWPPQDPSPCYACQADVIRYVALLRHGGIYVDADIECYKSIEDIIEEKTDFIGLKPHASNRICNGFIASSKGYKLMEDVVKDLRPRSPASNGPCYLSAHLYKFLSEPNGGEENRCPVETLQRENIKILMPSFWGNIKLKPNSYCIHHASYSWRTDKLIAARKLRDHKS